MNIDILILINGERDYMYKLFIVLFAINTNLFAATYQKGFDFYIQGQYDKSKKILRQVLSEVKDDKVKLKTLKLLGIVFFMTGNKKSAKDIFKKALKKDPSLKISQDEVLDQEVLTFFSSLREEMYLGSKKNGKLAYGHLKINSNYKEKIVIDDQINSYTNKLEKLKVGFHKVVIFFEKKVYKTIYIQIEKDKLIEKDIKIKKAKTKSPATISDSKTTSVYIHLMPFGIGDFIEKKYTYGLALLALQASSLGFGIYSWRKSIGAKEDGDREIKKYVKGTDRYNSVKKDYDDTIDTHWLQMKIAYGVFGFSWLANIIYKLIKGPELNSQQRLGAVTGWDVSLAKGGFLQKNNDKKQWYDWELSFFHGENLDLAFVFRTEF
jgi:tetratricopeptide (TPR) repeat protein